MRRLRFIAAVAGLLAFTSSSFGYAVGPPLSLEKLTDEADIIFKGTAESTSAAQDEWFKSLQGFVAKETQFKIISVIKGDALGGTLRFRHYDESPPPRMLMYQPRFYHFDGGRTYIVFAKKTEVEGVLRQLWANHKGKEDQGVVLCSDDKPTTAKSVKEILWTELTTGLSSASASNVLYAIRQLDQMSGGGHEYNSTQDFARQDVLAVVHELMTNSDSRIVNSAVIAIGSHNPYLSEERTEFWLATVGSAEVPGLGKMDSKMENVGGEAYWRDLVAIADQNRTASTRALAIRALGLVRKPALEKPITRWLSDAEPEVRASAVLLLADFPGVNSSRQLTTLAGDAATEVRASVARSIGFGQQAQLSDVLARLLADKDAKVRKVAAMSLLSFSPKIGAVGEVFRANVANPEFQPLFLNALARDNPEAYLDSLGKAVEEKTTPSNGWSGEIPAFTAWKTLFKYLRAQPVEAVRSGRLDRYLDAMEQVGNYSSSQPRDIYAFYLQRGMTERAKAFRTTAKKRVTYDLDYYFNMVDANPSLYDGE